MQPQIWREPPPCLTVCSRFRDSSFSWGLLQVHWPEAVGKTWKGASSEKITFLQKVGGWPAISLAKANLLFLWFLVSRGFLSGFLAWNPFLWRVRRISLGVTLFEKSRLISLLSRTALIPGWARTLLTIFLCSRGLRYLGRPGLPFGCKDFFSVIILEILWTVLRLISRSSETLTLLVPSLSSFLINLRFSNEVTIFLKKKSVWEKRVVLAEKKKNQDPIPSGRRKE